MRDNTVLCGPDHAAYLIYTSGSTGRPKGVVISHRNAVHSTTMRRTYYDATVNGFLLLSPFSFDSSVAGIFWTLSQGGRLCIPLEAERRDPLALGCLLHEQSISHLLCLPSLYQLQLLLEQVEPAQLRTLQTVIVAGETCPSTIVASHFAQLPTTRLYNEYGPTEGTVWCSVHQLGAGDGKDGRPLPIGHPIGNTQIHLLDAELNPVPVGVSGELYIGGNGIARGYHGQPRLTAERFLPDPFAAGSGARLYRTGDRARYLEQGVIEFLGRGDNQVKIRGYRIEPGEIEAHLAVLPAIQQAVVLARVGRCGQQRLIAYLLPVLPCADRAAREALVSDVLAALKAKLPDYMVPADCVVMDAMPQMPNGKIDRAALPDPDPQHRSPQQPMAPRNDVETRLLALWRDVLGSDRLGIDDNFFDAGGDSILAMQWISRARGAGFAFSPRDVFQHQTVAELARVAGQTAATSAEQGPVSGAVPLLPVQCWLFERHLRNPHHWNQSVMLELNPALTADILQKAVDRLLLHHDALRMRFHQADGRWFQTCHPHQSGPVFHAIDLSRLGSGQQIAALRSECERWQSRLHLTTGPLIRVVRFELGAERPPRLLIVVHHLVVDGVSWRILIEDLQFLLKRLLHREDAVLPAKTTSVQAWARRLHDYGKSTALAGAVDYWSEVRDSTMPSLPVDRPDGDRSEGSTEIVTLDCRPEQTAELVRSVAAAHPITVADMLLAALVMTLTAWSRHDAIWINLEGHGREDLFQDVDLSRTVGWFTALYPQLLQCPHDASPVDGLIAIKRQLSALPDHGIGYGILRYLQPAGRPHHAVDLPEAEVSFNYFGRFQRASDDGRPFLTLLDEYNGRDFDPINNRVGELGVDARIIDDRLRIDWNYSAARYNQATIRDLADRHLANLMQLAAFLLQQPPLPWHTLLPEADRQPYVRMIADAVLAQDIRPAACNQLGGTGFNAVLLTGGTGFVGAFLLAELIRCTAAIVYCLVRAPNETAAAARLFGNLDQYGIEIARSRIIPICGDLAEPQLGLSAARFNALSLQLDAIIHNGAATNLIQSYSAVRAANVTGTATIIRLACLNRLKPIHHISTLSVFGDAESGADHRFSEQDRPALGPWLTMGYAQSKWVAEQLIRQAGERGCPYAIYRLGTVTGHSTTGAWNREDFQFRLFTSAIASGKIPAIGDLVDMTPVDYVARAIVALARRQGTSGQTFHIVNPEPLPIDDFVALLNAIGLPVAKAPYGEWKKRMVAAIGDALTQTLQAELPNLVQMSLSTLSGILATKLAAITPPGLDRLFFCNSGTEAVEAAIKFSRYATGRSDIVYCDGAFHGMTLGSLSLASDPGLRQGFGPFVPGCIKISYNDLDALEFALRQRQAAALIVEPIQGEGVIVPDPHYLADARRLCHRYDTLFVADEVQTGLGRTGAWWAVNHLDVEPDMLLMAKALCGGFVPVGAVAMRRSIMDGVYSSLDRAGVHGSTFSKNNLAMAAGIATLDVLQDDNLIDQAARSGTALLTALSALKKPGGLLKDVRGKGLMIGIEFGAPAAAEAFNRWHQFETARPGLFAIALTCVLLHQHQILSQVSGHESNLIKLLPPLNITESDRNWILTAFDQSLDAAEHEAGRVWQQGSDLLRQASQLQTEAEACVA